MKLYIYITILLTWSVQLQAQKTLEEYQELIRNHQTEKISDEKLTEEYGPLFRMPNKFAERKKKEWIERPKQGNGKGIFTHRGAIFEGNFTNYKLNGSFTATYKGIPVIKGVAKDGTVTEGTFYKLRFHMPLYSSDIPYEKHLVGTYSVPVYSGSVHHVRTFSEDFIKLGTGVEYKLHYLSKYDSHYPNIYEAIYSERVLPKSGDVSKSVLDGNTWYFRNMKKQGEAEWDLFSASFIKNGKLQGEFVSANQPKYSVMARFLDGQNSHMYRVFNKENWDYQDFDSQQFTYEINEEMPYLTVIDYHDNESWEAHLEDLERERQRLIREEEERRFKADSIKQAYELEQKRIANRWELVETPCGYYQFPGREYDFIDRATDSIHIQYGNSQVVSKDRPVNIKGFHLKDQYSKGDYVLVWTGDQNFYEASAEQRALITAQITQDFFATEEYEKVSDGSGMYTTSIEGELRTILYYKYEVPSPYYNPNKVYVRSWVCDGKLFVKIINAWTYVGLLRPDHKDYKKFMF